MRHAQLSMTRLAAYALLGLAGLATAQSGGGPYRIEPQRIGSGGGVAGGGVFEARATIAQPEAGGVLAAGAYEVTGGFHRRGVQSGPLPLRIHADGFETR